VTEQKQAKRFYVSGRVQGVGYRYFAQRVAGEMGLSGYVKNLYDGRVEVYAVGLAAQLQALREELRRGPRHALVEVLDELDAEIAPAWSQNFVIEDE
jgi:acylphosphatase